MYRVVLECAAEKHLLRLSSEMHDRVIAAIQAREFQETGAEIYSKA